MTALDQVRDWLARNDSRQADLARRLGVSEAAVSAWFRGAARPTALHRAAIETLTGVRATDWMTDDERRIAFGDDSLSGAA